MAFLFWINGIRNYLADMLQLHGQADRRMGKRRYDFSSRRGLEFPI